MTATNAFSVILLGAKNGGKYEPCRSLGTRSAKFPSSGKRLYFAPAKHAEADAELCKRRLRRRRQARLRLRVETLGFTTHMHGIRSWEKLTSEGLTFVGHDLIKLIEEVLPAKFGGSAADYQFVETERAGLPKVDLLVSPRLGKIDEEAVLTTALQFLDRTPGSRTDLADRWRQGNTVSVVRAEPIATSASKVMALHVMRGKEERAAPTEPRVAARGR